MVMLQIPTLIGEGYFGIYSTHCWNVAANSDLMLGDQTPLGDDPYLQQPTEIVMYIYLECPLTSNVLCTLKISPSPL